MWKHPAVALSAVVACAALAACGSSGTSSASPTGTSGAAAVSSTATGSASPTSTSASVSSAGAAAIGAAAGKLAIGADPTGKLAFTKKTLTARSGTVTITFTNSSPLQHNFTLQKGANGAVLGATPTFVGGSHTLTLKLAPGTYTFYCSVPGHRMAGMQGTLTVG